MKAAPHPSQAERLSALHRYGILDTPREQAFDDVVALVSELCGAPIAVVNLIDKDRQWFKAEVGLGVRETPLDTSICSHVILENDFVEIPDTHQDARTSDNPLCFDGEDSLRFYAGALLKADDNLPIGTLCVLDNKPRQLTDLQRRTIKVLADQVMKQLDLRLALDRQAILQSEVDHRVKNSLAMVGSMIRLQSKKIDHPDAKAALAATGARVEAIAAVHQAMHDAGTMDMVDIKPFMQTIRESTAGAAPANVEVTMAFDPVVLPSSVASSIAMIVNEFAANSIRYGFPDEAPGHIEVRGRVLENDMLEVTATDDGIGNSVPSPVKTDGFSTGLGMRIIKTSAANIGAELESELTSDGARLKLTVPLKK